MRDCPRGADPACCCRFLEQIDQSVAGDEQREHDDVCHRRSHEHGQRHQYHQYCRQDERQWLDQARRQFRRRSIIGKLNKQQEEQQTQAAQTGQAIVDYACQFIGNPYVWGGTSLTNGADCSGFVQSVFAHFGISLPRTTWDMENVGTAVSYDQAVAGDIILYDGHVGIYMGNGQIVNAINSAKGIGILPATYTNIVTVRRLV